LIIKAFSMTLFVLLLNSVLLGAAN
jgi:hypothetical protein